jgi:mannose-6-phosphate isomerase-like protein (cupin superfamily)
MLLTGPPQTAGMVSGRIVLRLGAAMHRHSTEGHEELLVVLQGRGQVVLGREPVSIAVGEVLYIPPGTEHEVRNVGTDELRYIFVAAPARRCAGPHRPPTPGASGDVGRRRRARRARHRERDAPRS